MENYNIYSDIATRTGGDIYIGVVGPVRSGKSTFIKKFMETLVIPKIENDFRKTRAIDELPQSSAGRTIMTTEPKFIPEEAVSINLDNSTMNVRMIDCVGYIIPSSIGYIENDAPRMVMTPWFENEIPFNMAAEIGTKKVITEHSTIGLVVTTDGSFSDISRDEYEEAEERVINELNEINKPFVVLLNCVDPTAEETVKLKTYMEEKYSVPVIAINCTQLDDKDTTKIISKVLYQFPINELYMTIPPWILSLEPEHWLKKDIVSKLVDCASQIKHINDVESSVAAMTTSQYVNQAGVKEIKLGTGTANTYVDVNQSLFYKILGEKTGIDIKDEGQLMTYIFELSKMKKDYDKIKDAIDEVNATGYGIVMPSIEELTLEEPKILKQGGKYGVQLSASAPSIHITCNKQKLQCGTRWTWRNKTKPI
ncbi:MAG: stage IV sporulation protein A [Oscillospiraceae bacterium]